MGDVQKKKSAGSVRIWIPLLAITAFAAAGIMFAAWAMPGDNGPEQLKQQTTLSAEDMQAATDLAAGNNEFAFDLHRELAGEVKGNFTCSPYSVSVAMAMVNAGARGLSRDEITGAMHFDMAAPGLYDAFGGQNSLIDSIEGGTLANSAWVQNDYTLNPDYERLIRETFGSLVENVNFGQREKAVGRINEWTSTMTQDRIPEILTPADVNELTRLVLVNCIDLDMQWDEDLDDRNPGHRFILEDGNNTLVSMMRRKSEVGYYSNPEYSVVQLPFSEGDPREMIIILPQDHAGLSDLEAQLDAEFLAGLIDKLKMQDVIVALPPFKLDSVFDLIPALRALGIEEIFGMNADLSGMNASGIPELYISKAIQKAMTEVDEQGVKAAAATAVVATLKGGPSGPPETYFYADHPFLYIVRDTRTGAVLFTGRITDPTGLQG